MSLTREKYLDDLAKKYGERRRVEFDQESSAVVEYFDAVTKRLSESYEIERVLAVGGTGIVHVGQHRRFHQPVVIKINRPNIDADSVSMVENEANVLPALRHPNIVAVLDLGKLPEFTPKLTYIVEPFIVGSRPLFTFEKDRAEDTWLLQRVAQLRAQMPAALNLGNGDDAGQSVKLIAALLAEIAALFSQWVNLLAHVHGTHDGVQQGYAYLDVKPENVLVDAHLHLSSIDFGSIERIDPADRSPVEVFFTERYAHPELLRRKRDKPSSNRVRASIKRADIKHAFDRYALGISMLEVLNEVAELRPNVVPQIPLYRSLHFLATRLLDGQNTNRQPDNHYPNASQVFPGLKDTDYVGLSYVNLSDTFRDLEKERGRWNLESQVPELATYSKDIVRVVPGFNTVLTSRLRRVIEHPLVARLKYVSQLGLVTLLYPTADHSRYDHALGSYTYTTYYLKSLFNDLGNPIFRNLVGAEDMNAVLLAALLHDLGQYPLAHDLEEVHDRIFKHGTLGAALLEDSLVDGAGRTLLDIIEDPQNGWGVQADTLRQILGAHSRNRDVLGAPQDASLKMAVLAAIVDGPVDADKADYIIRDSARCELPYGAQLDLERLLRVLTVAILPRDTAGRRVTLGVYDKGLASAHAFGQARYQLFATVYWHHTSRIAKTMLQYAAAMGLPAVVFGPRHQERIDIEAQLRERLLTFIKSLVPPFDVATHEAADLPRREPRLDISAEPPADVVVETEHTRPARTHWYPGIAWSDWLMLEWIRKLPMADERSARLIDGLESRRLYKRVAALSPGSGHDGVVRKLEDLTWPDRLDLSRKLHDVVSEKIKRDWAHLNTAVTMGKSDFERLCDSQLLVLIDVPSPAKKIGYDQPLGVVPELREKSYQQDTRDAAEDKKWREIMATMMASIAPVRILCHPDVRNLVGALCHPVDRFMADELGRLL